MRVDPLQLMVWADEANGVYADPFIWWLESELGPRVTDFLDNESLMGPFSITVPLGQTS
jgi:hypothetical protein